MLTPEEIIEAARQDHEELVLEFERLHAWVSVCLGTEVAAWNGLKVDA